MPRWSTAVLVIFAVSLWFTRKHNSNDPLNVSLNSTYDYIIGKPLDTTFNEIITYVSCIIV